MAKKKKPIKKSTSLKMHHGKNEKIHKETLYDKINKKINLQRFAAPIWGLGVGILLFLLMWLINNWQYGLLIGGSAAILIGIAVYIINKD